MEIEILGPMTVRAHGHRYPVRGEKVRATLAMLVLSVGQVVSCEELVNELWADNLVRNAKNALQAHIARLRRLLDDCGEQRVLETVDNGYILKLPQAAIDANRFHKLTTAGVKAVNEHPDEAVILLEQALGLWRGAALLDAGPGVRCRAAASWLDESRVIALEDLMTARLACGDERFIVSELEHLAARYPMRERFCEMLMLALYRCGRQVEALDVFHRLRHRLGNDLGLQPGVGLQRRYTAILAHDPALSATVSV